MVVSVEASTGSATAFVPFERSASHVEPYALVAVDGFEHDDGVVDEPPHGQRQAAQRERVERLAARVEHDEGDREGERDGHRDDHRPAHAL